MIKNYIRALRLPFISASALPFIFGSLIDRGNFNWPGFFLGLICSISTHLSANLINDYADSKSGVDEKEKRFFGLFGGSKLIQEGVFSEKFYLYNALLYFGIAAVCVFMLSLFLNDFTVFLYFFVIVFLGFSYSHKPLKLVYNRFGELIIFILFSPAVVMGAYFIQTNIFPDLKSFLLSLPFGLFTVNILFSNEVPDFNDDYSSGKNTWVSLAGVQKAYLIYCAILFAGLLAVFLNMRLGLLKNISMLIFLLSPLCLRAAVILKNDFDDKEKLLTSSRLTILFQIISGLILILSL